MDETNARSIQVNVSYDKNTDTFYLYFSDEPKKSIIRDTGNGILLQLDAETKRPIGAIVHDFEARFAKQVNGRQSLSISIPKPLAYA